MWWVTDIIVIVTSWDNQCVQASKTLYFDIMWCKLYQVYLNKTVSWREEEGGKDVNSIGGMGR